MSLPASKTIAEALKERILVLDGAMGTMIQQFALTEADYRPAGIQASGKRQLKGCNDLLNLSRPDVIGSIHTAYIDAGADIIETNTFNANAISLEKYGMDDAVERINRAGAAIAREAADKAGRQVWVAGSVGPTGKSLSMELSMQETEATGFDALAGAYLVQMKALIDAGVDLLLIETQFDGLNARAAVYAARQAMEQAGREVPVIVSATLTEQGRTLSGQSVEAFVASIAQIKPLAVSLNCGFGADGMKAHIESMQKLPFALGAYPNAGLPNAMGEYDETPASFAEKMGSMLSGGMLNIAGGCCGTTPEHIRALAMEASTSPARKYDEMPAGTMVTAGLDCLTLPSGAPFVNIGERCNVAGSRKFLRLIKEENYDEALEIAKAQIEAGAQIIDVNLDDAMLDARARMHTLLGRLGSDPATAKVPVMIDSSDWEVVTEALKCVQGKPIVNSISLKEGEEIFKQKARHIKQMGAAVVVMAFDEQGQAVDFERKRDICGRAYSLLTREVGMNPADIIFDPNILTVGTGIDEHRRYAIDFLRATRWIKENLPGSRVSGGVSNLSFAFRGNNPLREAIHAVFLDHAVKAGLDMAIVNPSTLVPVHTIDPQLRERIDDLLLDRRDDAVDRLLESNNATDGILNNSIATGNATEQTVEDRIALLVQRGSVQNLEQLLDEAVEKHSTALAVIDRCLMPGLNRVGGLFGRGEMFLPQVVKSASVMKKAVSHLAPLMERTVTTGSSGAPRMVLATVKGDVHDIGKNILAVILRCNGIQVTDLGVMVPAEQILDKAIEEKADFVGVSGLITPSLGEMCHIAAQMEERGMRIPLFVGGAAASAEHTAVKIAPCYSGPVVYTHDAARLPVVARRLLDPASREETISELTSGQQALRDRTAGRKPLLSLAEARRRKPDIDMSGKAPKPLWTGTHNLTVSIAEATPWINVRALFAAWKLDASLAAVAEIDGCDHCRAQWIAAVPEQQRPKAAEAMQLWKQTRRMLKRMADAGLTINARVVLDEACSDDNDNITIAGKAVLPTLRRQTDDGEPCTALADFIDRTDDWAGAFVVTVGPRMEEFIAGLTDGFDRLLAQSLADRLVEAATEIVHHRVRKTLWGYAPLEDDTPRRLLRAEYQGIRPAIGYPSLPDQSLVFETDKLLHYADLGVTLTENGALKPAATVTGLMLGHSQSRYFTVGSISPEAATDYCRRRGIDETECRRFLPC